MQHLRGLKQENVFIFRYFIFYEQLRNFVLSGVEHEKSFITFYKQFRNNPPSIFFPPNVDSLLGSGDFRHVLITFANSLDTVLDTNRLTH